MTNTQDSNRVWKEACLSSAKTDARDFFHGAMLHAHNGKLHTAKYRFDAALYYLEQVHRYAQELSQCLT